MPHRTILITHSDMSRLRRLLESALHFLRRDRSHLEALEHELNNAQVVPTEEIPQNVVVLNSRVRLRDLDTGRRTAYTLVFPKDSHTGEDRLSVLAPIGTAILGRRLGDVVECIVPAGVRMLKIEEVEEISRGTLKFDDAA